MPFFVGDDFGNVKRLVSTYTDGASKLSAEGELVEGEKGKKRAIQSMTFDVSKQLLALSRADGSSSSFNVDEDGKLSSVHEWSEQRFKAASGHRYVGININGSHVFTCTTSGHVRKTQFSDSKESVKASVPTRLTSFELSQSGSTFAYGGDEVDLSIWDVSRAFGASEPNEPTESKRKTKKTELFPGELWRAKNLPNDNLNLRQPIHITSLAYLPDPNEKQLVAGTYSGSIRRYDTRTARRPVEIWDKIIQDGQGSISVMKHGQHENELFFASSQSTVSSLDLRNGRILYTYRGISGAVNALAPSQSLLASTSLDRLVRIHSTSLPGKEASAREEGPKPSVLDNLFWKFTPTVICWDGGEEVGCLSPEKDGLDEEEDKDLWNEMQNASDLDGESEDSEDEKRFKKKRRKDD